MEWVDDDRIIVEPSRLLRELRAGKVTIGEIFLVDVKAGRTTPLISMLTSNRFSQARSEQRQDPFIQARVFSMHSGNPDEILIESNSAINGRNSTLSRFNIRTKRQDGFAAAPLPAGRFILGENRRAALFTGQNQDGNTIVYYMPPSTGKATVQWQRKFEFRREEEKLLPFGWTGKGDEYYAYENRDLPTRGVVVWDAVSGNTRLLFPFREICLGCW
jgi:hypothetical protein